MGRAALAVFVLLSSCTGLAPVPLSPEQRTGYRLDPAFFAKGTVAQGILVASSARVPDVALLEAAYLFDRVLEGIDPVVAARVRADGVLCVLLGREELTSDVPMFASDKKGRELDFYNWRQRGFLTRVEGRRVFLFAEEDVLEYEGGMQKESILVHELAHVVQAAGFDPVLQEELAACFENAKAAGLWKDGRAAQRFKRVTGETPVPLLPALLKAFPKESPELLRKCLESGDILVNGKAAPAGVEVTGKDEVLIVFGGEKRCYALQNQAEYWAEGFQCWYDTNRVLDHDHNHIRTRGQLKAYDPRLAALCEKVLGDGPWRFVSPRERRGREHLADFDPAASPMKVQPAPLQEASLDYYDTYWKDYWPRLYRKHGIGRP
jgi:hypothetical protein